jgi:hypothetical protein
MEYRIIDNIYIYIWVFATESCILLMCFLKIKSFPNTPACDSIKVYIIFWTYFHMEYTAELNYQYLKQNFVVLYNTEMVAIFPGTTLFTS